MRRLRSAALLLLLPATGLLAAERLVLRDGTAVEIRGDYERKGALVVFTLANGRLGSLRADDIDFEATAAANAPTEPKDGGATESDGSEAPRAPVLVLTDADVPSAPAVPSALSPPIAPPLPDPSAAAAIVDGAPEDAIGLEGGTPAPSGSVFVPVESALKVTGWSVEDRGTIDGLELVGTLINDGTVLAVDVAVSVTVEGAGTPRTFEAFVANPVLGAGRRTSFRVPLIGEVTAPESPAFSITGRGLRPRIVPEPESDESDESGLNDGTSENPRDRTP